MKKPQFANRSNRHTNNNPVSSGTPSQPQLGNLGLNESLSMRGLNPFDRESSCHPRRRDMMPPIAPTMNPNEMAAPGGFYPPYQTGLINNPVHNTMLLDREAAISYINELKSNTYLTGAGKTRTGEEIIEAIHMLSSDQPYPAPNRTMDLIILTQMSAEEFINLYLDTLDKEDIIGLSDLVGDASFNIQQNGNRMYSTREGRTYLIDQTVVDQVMEGVDVKEEGIIGVYQLPAVSRLYRMIDEKRTENINERVRILSDLINDMNAKPSIDHLGLASITFVGKDVSVIVQPSMLNPFCNDASYKVTWIRHNPQLTHEAEQTYNYDVESFFNEVVPKIKQLVTE